MDPKQFEKFMEEIKVIRGLLERQAAGAPEAVDLQREQVKVWSQIAETLGRISASLKGGVEQGTSPPPATPVQARAPHRDQQ